MRINTDIESREKRASAKARFGPHGVHLFDRSTGLNVLMDEVAVPERNWHRAPRHVSIALTNACDLHCLYCYAAKAPARLDERQVVGWLDELDENGCLGVGFGGGEPTLHKGLAGICAHSASSTSMAIGLTTHGHWSSPSLADRLEGNVHFVRVSVDGVRETYERLRGRSFAALRGRLAELSERFRFGINVVVNRHTIVELDAVANLAAEAGAMELLLLPEQTTARSGGIDESSRDAMSSWCTGYRGHVPLSVSESDSAGLPTFNPTSAEVGLRSYAHVDAFGVVKRSSFHHHGVKIAGDGIMAAIAELEGQEAEESL